MALSTPRTDEATLQLALASMQLAGAGSRADPEAAASLLTELGVFRRHEPLALLQRGVSEESPEDEVRVAQVGGGKGRLSYAKLVHGSECNREPCRTMPASPSFVLVHCRRNVLHGAIPRHGGRTQSAARLSPAATPTPAPVPLRPYIVCCASRAAPRRCWRLRPPTPTPSCAPT